MKYINKLGMIVVAGSLLATASCSDYSDYNTAPEDANQSAGYTLYENIKSNAKLQNFAAIIDKAGYADVLNSPQCYTMWAPADGTYDANAILAMSKEDIVQKFLKQHIAQFSYPVSGDVDARVITLNDKHHVFTNTNFDEYAITQANIPSANGMIHLIDGMSPYYTSIYEHLSLVEGSDSISDYILSYNDSVIDVRNSVPGPMLNGQQTYKDTVWRYTNPIIREILRADIEDEDSCYVMLLPTDKAWRNAYETIKKDFHYATNFNFMDISENTTPAGSITVTGTNTSFSPNANKIVVDIDHMEDSITKGYLTKNLVYSMSYKYNEPMLTGQLVGGEKPDTVRSTTRDKLSNVEEILSYCTDPVKMSNGYVRQIDSVCFKSYETYERILSYRMPMRYLGLKDKVRYSSYSMTQDVFAQTCMESLSELPDFLKRRVMPETSKYVNWISTDIENLSSQTSKPELDFALDGVVSTAYKIYVVFAPFAVTNGEIHWNNEGETAKDLYVQFHLAYNNADGAMQFRRLNVEGAKSTDDIIIPSDGKFHAVELPYTFEMSYAGLNAWPTLFVSHTKNFTSSTNRKKYEQELRIQGIYLVPEGAEDYVKTLKF